MVAREYAEDVARLGMMIIRSLKTYRYFYSIPATVIACSTSIEHTLIILS